MTHFLSTSSHDNPRDYLLSQPIKLWTVNNNLVNSIISNNTLPPRCILEIHNAINISDRGSIDEIKQRTTVKLILTDG